VSEQKYKFYRHIIRLRGISSIRKESSWEHRSHRGSTSVEGVGVVRAFLRVVKWVSQLFTVLRPGYSDQVFSRL